MKWIMLIIDIVNIMIFFVVGLYCGGKIVAKNVNTSLKQLSKSRQMNSIFEDWIKYENSDNSVIDYLKQKGYSSIVIYGGTAIAECLVGRLQKEIDILAIMDRDSTLDFGNIPTLAPGEVPKGTDCIIVTTIGQFQNIKNDLKKDNDVPMIYIGEIFR